MADTLTITDNRTGKIYDLPIQDGTIRAMDLRKIKTDADTFKVKVPREVAAQLRQGDSVRLDLSFQPTR